MKNWKRKIRNIGLPLCKISLCFFMFSLYSVKADEMISEKYLFSFKSYKSTCFLRVNNLPAVDNFSMSSGTMSAGFNLTAFLENGVNNIEMLMGALDYEKPETLAPDATCQLIVTKDTEDSSVEIANIKLSVNDKGEITAGASEKSVNNPNDIKLLEGYTKNEQDFGLYKVAAHITLRGLPKWSWASATSVTEDDLPKIRKAYADIWNMIKARDIEGLKKITHVSTEEMAYAEGSTSGMMFISTDFPQHVIDKKLSPVPIVWDKYKLRTYRSGRLFRLAVGFYQNSPLKFQDANGKTVFVYNPYFSIIDGRVVLVR